MLWKSYDISMQDEFTLDMQGTEKQVFDVGLFVEDLALDEDARR